MSEFYASKEYVNVAHTWTMLVSSYILYRKNKIKVSKFSIKLHTTDYIEIFTFSASCFPGRERLSRCVSLAGE